MHHKFFIILSRLIVKVMIWFTSRKFPYFEMYSFNCEPMHVFAHPIPITRQGLGWISVPNKGRKERSKSLDVLNIPPHDTASSNLDSLRNFAKFQELDLIKDWLPAESSNLKIIKSIRRENSSGEFSRIIFHKPPLLREGSPRGFHPLVQLKIRNFVY